MRSLADFQLSDSELDDVLPFWHFGDQHHAVITGDYSTSTAYLERLLTRSFGGRSTPLGASLNKLGESGEALPIWLGQHCLGLLRPKLLGDPSAVRAARTPFLICFEADARKTPTFPLLAASRDSAASLVRELHLERGVDKQRWREYKCERLRGALEHLVVNVRNGALTTYSTDLERELASVLRSPKRRVA